MEYRLPTTVLPTRYDLRLEPDLDAATFHGEESIAVTVKEAVTEVVLNAAELRIQSVAAERADGAVVQGSVALEAEAERARLFRLRCEEIPAQEVIRHVETETAEKRRTDVYVRGELLSHRSRREARSGDEERRPGLPRVRCPDA